MPPRIIVSSILENLDANTFGLALSVGVEDAGTPSPADVMDAALWACPWLWSITGVRLATRQAGVPTAITTNVQLLGVHATPAPAPPSERAVIVGRLFERYKRLRTPDDFGQFLWNRATDNEGQELTLERPIVRWPFELQAAGKLGAPHAHWLNVSVFFRVETTPAVGDALVAAPLITLRRLDPNVGDADKFDLKVAIEPNKLDIDGDLVVWEYAPAAGQTAPAEFSGVFARCSCVGLPLSSEPWWLHDKDSITVRSWRGTLFRDASRRTSPPTLLARAGVLWVDRNSTISDVSRLRTLIIDGAFRLLPNYRTYPESLALTDLADGLRRESVALEGNENAKPDAKAYSRAAKAIDALRAALKVPDLGAGTNRRAEVLRKALIASGTSADNASNMLATPRPEANRAVAAAVAADRLRELAGALTNDDALIELWAEAVTPTLSADDRANLKQVLAKSGRLADALAADSLRPTWERFVLARNEPSDVDFATAVRDEITGWAQASFPATLATVVLEDLKKQWALLTPKDAERYSIDNAVPYPMTPHPLVLWLGAAQSDPAERTSSSEAEKVRGDWEDPLRWQLGVGLLVRDSAEQFWHCPTLGVAARVTANVARFTVQPLGRQLTVIPSARTYQDKLSTNTIAYDGRWLGAFGPEEELNTHGLYVPNSGEGEPLCSFAAPTPQLVTTPGKLPLDASPWLRIPLPRFSSTLQMAAFRVSLSGGLPPEIRDPQNPGRLRDQSKNPQFNNPKPPFWSEKTYRRAVPVGAPRLCNANGPGGAPPVFPAVPKGVHLRAVEIPGPDEPNATLTAEQRAGANSVLVLAVDQGAVPSTYRFAVRPPAVGHWDTWFRWQFKRDGAPDAKQLAEVFAAVKHREDLIHEAVANRAPTTLTPFSLDDPAVVGLGIVLLECIVSDTGTSWRLVGKPVEVPLESMPPNSGGEPDGVWVDGLPAAAATNARRVPIAVTAIKGGSSLPTEPIVLVNKGRNAEVRVEVVEGGMYQIATFALVKAAPTGLAPAEWDSDAFKKWEAAAQVPLGVSFANRRVLSASRVTIEVATKRWNLKLPDQKVEKSLYDALKVTRREPVMGARSLYLEAETLISDHPYLHSADLCHQRWSWSGRPVDLKHLSEVVLAASGATGWIIDPANAVANWEATEFGDLDDAGSVLPLDVSLSDAAGRATLVKRTAPVKRKWSRTIDLSGEIGASYHRIALVVHHRYEAIFNIPPLVSRDTTATNDSWRWHSLLVKARPSKPAAAIALRRLIPLISTGAGREDDRTPGPAGFIALAADEAFNEGGLAERWRVEVVTASGYQGYTHREAGIDPRYKRSIEPEKVGWAELPIDKGLVGPFGHSLESQIVGARIGRFTSHSYMVKPSVAEGQGDVPWLVRFRIGRYYDPALLAPGADEFGGEPREWSETPWIPLQPDRRIIATNDTLQDVTIQVAGADRTVLHVVDSLGRRIGERTSDKSPTSGVLNADNDITNVFLFVTQRITDIGGADSEMYVGLFQPYGLEWKQLPASDEKAAVESLSTGPIIARMMYCSHIALGFSQPATADEAWRRILGQEISGGTVEVLKDPTIEEIRNRLAWDGMSDPIFEEHGPSARSDSVC